MPIPSATPENAGMGKSNIDEINRLPANTRIEFLSSVY
ncbi:hypothetical protein AGR5A_Lc20178 [Agrobacterium genomosp. 5 str. CFBP 6626]|nr:hypothetical protein AGR5A_Lc20178 [Agrobacterium genomosp. 5 str. CFBP 6626]